MWLFGNDTIRVDRSNEALELAWPNCDIPLLVLHSIDAYVEVEIISYDFNHYFLPIDWVFFKP